jgi:ABC-type phosphate transport system permease subunit
MDFLLKIRNEAMDWWKSGISESSFRKILYLTSACVVILLVAILLSLVFASLPAIRNFGMGFLFETTWDPVKSEFGALPFAIGSLYLFSPLQSLLSSPCPSPFSWANILGRVPSLLL